MEQKNLSKNIKKKIIIGIVIALAVIISFTLGFFTKVWTTGEKERTVAWVISMIDGKYYCEEDGKVKEFSAEDYAQAIVDSLLDKYSDYYSAEQYSDVLETNKGNNYGVGVKFLSAQTDNTLLGVTGNSPADKAGLKEGDKIVGGKTALGERVNFETKEQVLSFLSNIEKDVRFTLFYVRGGAEEQAVSLEKSVFVTSYVKYYDKESECGFYSQGSSSPSKTVTPSVFMSYLNDDEAYIRLEEFHGEAFSQMKTALQYMRERNKSKLILDLRNDGGGNMDVLCDIASLFIEEDDALVAFAKYKDGENKQFKTGKSNYVDGIDKICVVANENTASAAECLIGVLKYYGSAFNTDRLVIEKNASGVAKTYGKGIMQTTYTRLGGDAIKLTTAYIYQPDKVTSIHKCGFTATAENSTEKNAGIVRATEILRMG